jgi:glycerol kinase
LDRPVVRPAIQETTALGAAYAAGLATGFFADLEDLRTRWKQERSWIPSMPTTQRDKLYTTWKKAVTRSFDWVEEPQLPTPAPVNVF